MVLAASSGGMWQKGVRSAGRGDGGDAALPWGSGACHRSPSGAVPSGPEPAFQEPCEFKVRLEFWVGFAHLPSGDQGGCSVAPLEPYSQRAAEGWPETTSS